MIKFDSYFPDGLKPPTSFWLKSARLLWFWMWMVALPCALWICFEGVVNFPGGLLGLDFCRERDCWCCIANISFRFGREKLYRSSYFNYNYRNVTMALLFPCFMFIAVKIPLNFSEIVNPKGRFITPPTIHDCPTFLKISTWPILSHFLAGTFCPGKDPTSQCQVSQEKVIENVFPFAVSYMYVYHKFIQM